MSLHPTVRYLLVSEDVNTSADNDHRVTIVGLISSIRSLEPPYFPLLFPELCVFLQLTECRGAAQGRIEIRHADSDQIVFRTKERTLPLGNDPLEIVGVTFRIRNIQFREAGLHWIQFWYDERLIAQQPLLLRR